MSRKLHRSIRGLGVLAALAGGTFFSHAAMAADNYFLPHGINDWHVPSNWSLGHCPLQTEHVKIQATTDDPKFVTYDWTGVSGFGSVTIDGNGHTYYGAIHQPDLWLDTADLKMSLSGTTYYYLEGPAYLSANDHLYVGYSGSYPAYFTLDTIADSTAGLSVGNFLYVGYNSPGEFDHQAGFVETDQFYIGQSEPGTYDISGTTGGSKMSAQWHIVVGNGAAGTVEQTGGTIEQIQPQGTVYLGLNDDGVGTYNMRGGQLNITSMEIANNGDGYFNHTKGTVDVDDDVFLGGDGTHPMRAWYKMADTDGDPELFVGGNLKIGQYSLAKFEQNSGGTTIVDGNIEIWKGTADADYSYLYLGLHADWMEAAQIINHSGYYDQDGGTVRTAHLKNDSTYGINLDNDADVQATTVEHNAGTFYAWRNAQLRGQHAGGGVYNLCDFTNNATFQMGNAVFDGGTFFGILTNHGTFNYYQGDFTESRVINHGTVNLNEDLHCRRFENNANLTLNTDRWIFADGVDCPNAVENNGNLSMHPDSHIDVGNDSVFVNNGPMYAGGPGNDYAHIFGDVINNDYLLPCHSALPSGQLYINGNFTANPGAELRMRIHGTEFTEYDHLAVQETATLAGELDVRLTDGFVPALGDSFSVVACLERVGQFNPVYLPDLPNDWQWQLDYEAQEVTITVVEEQEECPADFDGDGDVDTADLLYLLGAWGTPDGDVDGDADTDTADLLALLAAWGECP